MDHTENNANNHYQVSFMYRHPVLYDFVMYRLIPGLTYSDQMNSISRLIGKNKQVFDIACGTSLLARYLDASCCYSGIDLNPSFIRHSKRRGLQVKRADMFDERSYPDKTDYIVISHVLHHISPREQEVIKLAQKHARSVVVVDDGVSPSWIITLGRKLLYIPWIFNFLGDSDGINDPHHVTEWSYRNHELISLFKSRGAISTQEVGSGVIGVFRGKIK